MPSYRNFSRKTETSKDLSAVNQLSIILKGKTVQIQEAAHSALKVGGADLTNYIKKNLLSGQMVNEVSGELKNSVYYTIKTDYGEKGTSLTLSIRLRDRVSSKTLKNGKARVWKASMIGALLHEGSKKKRWYITAKFKPFLVFEWNGRIYKRRQVEHPGLKPRPFLSQGLKDRKEFILTLVERSINTAVKKPVPKVVTTPKPVENDWSYGWSKRKS
jgi:hypothetical protein